MLTPSLAREESQAPDLDDYDDLDLVWAAMPDLITYRGRDKRTGQTVIIKFAAGRDESIINQLRHEYTTLNFLRSQDVHGVSEPLQWCDFSNGSAVIMVYRGKTFRESYLSRPVSERGALDYLSLMLRLRSIVHTLQQAHSLDCRHNNLRTDVFCALTEDSADVAITSWLYSSQLTIETPFNRAAILNTSLPYVAPECTGRMNTKIVDTRSDLYSLGVTFYEIITGQLPFNETSSLGLMHSHLAHSIAPLSHFPELKVPPMIDALVAKLLQKNPEDRYLTATSLLVDVDHIIQALEQGHDHASLEIGREDEVSRFRIAPEFVAREKELKHLCDLFDQVQETSESRVATVAGYSGVGKSRLVKEVFQILSHGNLFYAESKYDQFKPFAPFATFSTLFSDLLAQVFVETASNLSYWRCRLIDILGDELPQALCELCPDLVTLHTPAYVGSLPPLVPLSGLAAEKRFRRGISKLTQAFALKEKPLVLFVDDIQWAPLADLQLFCELRSQNNLILLTAYRDNEVDASHVVNTVFIPQIQPDLQLSLGALPLSGTRHLVCKTLRRPLPQGDAQPAEPPEVERFVLIIHAKTQGNAFFIGQVLQNLYAAELLKYNFEMAAWTWDIQAIQSIDASEDVVGLVLKQVHELSSDCRGVLAVASCLGNASFRLDIMSTALALPQSEIASSIFEAMQAGLVVADDERYKAAMLVSRDWPQEEGSESSNGKIGSVSYRFLHDRVQQACFDMVALDERPALHARIGLRLFATYKQDESMIFDICTQINHAKALVPEELRMEMAHFNICAATIAFKNTANEVAMSSLRAAETFFPDDPWAIQGDFVQSYYMLLEEVSTSLADYDVAKVAAEKVLAHATDDVVKVKVHGRLMKTALSAGRLQESLSWGIEGLRYAGFDLAPHFADGSDELVQTATAELWAAVPSSSADIAALRDMRVMADPLISAVLDILLDILPTVFFLRPSNVSLVILTGIKLGQDAGGNTLASSYFYGFASLLLSEVTSTFCDYSKALYYSNLATAVLEDLLIHGTGNQASIPAIMVITGCAAAWAQDARFEAARIFGQAQAQALRTYNHEYQAYACGNQNLLCLFSGTKLESLTQSGLQQLEAIESYKRPVGSLYVRPVIQTIQNLRSCTLESDLLHSTGNFSSQADEQEMLDLSLLLHAFNYYGCRLLTHALFAAEDHKAGLELVEAIARCSHGGQGVPHKAHYSMYSLFIMMDAEKHQALTPEQQQHKTDLFRYAQIWSSQCSSTFGPWHSLLQAESEKSIANLGSALQLFNVAIDRATDMSNLLLIGYFNERCARYLTELQSGLDRAAKGYVVDAIQAYQTWGCDHKCRQLAQTYHLAGSTVNHYFTTPVPRSVEDMSSINSTVGSSTTDTFLAVKTPLKQFPFKQSPNEAIAHHSHMAARHKDSLDTLEEASAELDLESVLQNALVLSSSEHLEEAIPRMLKHILQASGAQYVALVVAAAKEEGRFDVKVSGTVNNIQFHENIPLDDNQSFAPTRLIRLAANSRKAVIDNAKSLEKDRQEGLLPKSFIALPIRLQEKTLAILYLSNSEINDLFSSSRQVELLTIMATHTAISIEKIELLSELSEANRELSESKKAVEDHAEHLEFVVEERTRQLAKQNTELAAAKYEAEQASLRKNRFLSNISHEIRTPFNAVVGFATLLMDTGLDSDQRDMAQSIVDSSSNLLVIINDLLDLTKMEEGKMKLSPIWFDFRTLMESTLEMIARSAAQKQIDIAFIEDKHSSEIGSVFADDIRMRQSVLNLLSNAIKFTDRGGLVRVTSRSDFLGEADAEGNQSVRIFVDVQDNGIGIAKQDMSKLFGFFSQVDDSTTRLYGGTGLGLAISRKICRLFDGDLTVESESGVGSTFTASFCGKVNRKTNPLRPLQCKALSKQTCMILEPSSIVQEAIQQHLDAFGVPWFSKSDLAGVAEAVERADFCIIGDSFNQPETIRALRKRWVDVERLPLVVTMPFGSTLPAQPTTQDEDSIDAVLSTPIRRNRLLKALLSLFPGGDAPVIAAQPPVVITDNDSTEMKNDIKILLVEDNLVNVKVATKLLKRLGYVPKVAYDGLQAVQACAIEDFDLILMDVMMPVLSGLAATQEIRAAQAEHKAPFICAMTANAMAGDEQRCLAAGMDKYISKPIMLPKLKEVISIVEKKVQLGDCKG